MTTTPTPTAKTSLLKWFRVFSNIVAIVSTRFKCQMSVKLPGGLHPSLQRERTIRRRVFTSSMKCPGIRKFHVLVVTSSQWRQRNVPKLVMHLQSCCFGYQTSDVPVAIAIAVANCSLNSGGWHICLYLTFQNYGAKRAAHALHVLPM